MTNDWINRLHDSHCSVSCLLLAIANEQLLHSYNCTLLWRVRRWCCTTCMLFGVRPKSIRCYTCNGAIKRGVSCETASRSKHVAIVLHTTYYIEQPAIAHLSVSPHDRTEQLPRTTSPVDPHHAQDLKEPQSAQSGSGEHLAAGTETQYDDAGNDDDDVCYSIRYSTLRYVTAQKINPWMAIESLINELISKFNCLPNDSRQAIYLWPGCLRFTYLLTYPLITLIRMRFDCRFILKLRSCAFNK